MDREDLLRCLKRVTPALGRGAMPILSHLCFGSDGYVTAYDGVVALRSPCDVGFVGCVPGEVVSILSLSSAKQVLLEIGEGNSEVLFKIGRTRARFALLPEESYPFVCPRKSGVSIPIDDCLTGSLRIASRSASSDPENPLRSGITFTFSKRRITLYATDETTLVRVSIPRGACLDSVVMPSRFCELMPPKGTIWFLEGGGLYAERADVRLYGQAIREAETGRASDPKQFERVFEAVKPASIVMAEIPEALHGCIDRAMAVDKDRTEFVYDSGVLRMTTTFQGAEVKDSVRIDLGEVPIRAVSHAEYLARYLGDATSIGLSERSLVLEGEAFQVLLGVIS